MSDVLQDMIDELRQQRPPVYLADERITWFAAVGQAIAGMPASAARIQAIEDVARDLWVANPGMPESMCLLSVQVAVFSAEVQEHADR